MISFGKGHSWSLNLVRKGSVYQADSIVFVYNLTDDTLFPRAKENGNLCSSQWQNHQWHLDQWFMLMPAFVLFF